ncbi:putative proton-dependent oligopeptide transporter family, MFS transporter superfamily [Helianthus annuus]|uniref:Proton-dependent oligopeptide transporter family, MFS transporter superfamily n=1 Tax=Helianthus annuus TaxID=4232 RepID=A0A251TEN5_HELAN|nr:protein NRT1/ PTR FAMILY 4.6 [Helianthus annuus]KAF5764259.1 putative proton-dependent oligopeptide transporter family, MFS transporter superfamily [Helianthus annuus]KAJ0450963.1 putative proton-dependent oligopeptide transporter family, MFS transporter superfamily [Helianthus annuus]KAJ0472822.1 putative proton-dependent oligopeptide transporter family, MFS transporter superfamily [Helianthus annuus]KAJ0648430.1 putative proton-dependent oligopeptide transporter family, MFS transporter sup
MEVESQEHSNNIWEGYVDWKKKPAIKGKHGGMLAASFVLVVEVMENLAYLANASNLVLYLTQFMHFSPSKAANHVTDFMGTAFLLALLGGFLSDAFFTTYQIYLMSALVEFLGLVILTIQARSSSLKPPKCSPQGATVSCEQVHGAKAAVLFLGLYLVALGVGGIKGSLPSHGAEQFDENTAKGRKQRSTFFNYFVFCLAFGALIAVTFVIWIEDNKGWEWGFGISTLTILLSIPVFLAGSRFYRNKIPSGSPLTTIFKVLIGALLNNYIARSPSNAIVSMSLSPNDTVPRQQTVTKEPEEIETPSTSLKFLNQAAVNKPAYDFLRCSVQQVEDVKIVLLVLPIFACTIMLNCCLAQLSTFSVHQASTMDTKIGSLKVPAASLPVFPVVFIMLIAPIYDHIIIPFARKATKSEMGVSHLQRIGIGLLLSIMAMAVAALVEIKRKRIATRAGLDQHEPLPITFLWIAFQYLFLGSADLFTLAGLMEFFFSEAPANMKSLATSLSFASLAMGYYLSTVIVSVVNSATGGSGHPGWLSGGNLNHYHLERFYWLMCILSALNFLHYLFWAHRYRYQSRGARS